MTASDIAHMEILELAAALQARTLSPVEVTRVMLARIDRVGKALRCYATLMPDTAEQEALAAENEIAQGRLRGPLHGVPLAVKDLCDATGIATIAGMPHVRRDAIAAKDSTVVARLRAAGAVILGKLQLTEGAVAHHHPDVAPPLNPHNAAFWSGASSSGSGVATAAGLCFGSLGSDTGGSIRFPCFANGVTGIKPTWGRVSRAGVVALAPSLDHIGPMARSAADCGAILGAVAGADPDDPTALRAPVPDYLAGLGRGLGGLRIGFDEAYATEHVAPAITRAIREAVEVLRDVGATIKQVKVPSTDAVLEAWFAIFGPEAAAEHAATYRAHAAHYGPGLKQMVEAGAKFSGSDYAKAHKVRQVFHGQLDALFDQVDVVVAPAGMRHTMTLEEFARFGSNDSDWPDLLRFAAPFDMSGTPALPLPCGIDPDGVPFGFQLVAGHLNEKALVRAGDAYQRATSWHKRRPPLAA